MQIRPEQAGDVAAIRDVTAAAFANAPHSEQTEPAIVDALRKAGGLSLSLVAEDDDRIVGHVAFSPVTIDGQDGDWLGLGPVSVDPARQRQGIGADLIRAGLENIRSSGADGCVVLGDPSYYGRFGFVSDPKLTYPDVPASYFQRLVFSDVEPVGTVTFHPGFSAR
ncbi:N-acetyltransferase [Methylorubrum sp. Q1]|nr:N-acetyltransferase [Methylorubrum sp. Q1]TFZ54230.1 N-acetyltransferase [Methylorubrum sp. Q1]